jgi:hypothetical protein
MNADNKPECAVEILRAAINAAGWGWEYTGQYRSQQIERVHSAIGGQREAYIRMLREALSDKGLSEQSKRVVSVLARPVWIEATDDWRDGDRQ